MLERADALVSAAFMGLEPARRPHLGEYIVSLRAQRDTIVDLLRGEPDASKLGRRLKAITAKLQVFENRAVTARATADRLKFGVRIISMSRLALAEDILGEAEESRPKALGARAQEIEHVLDVLERGGLRPQLFNVGVNIAAQQLAVLLWTEKVYPFVEPRVWAQLQAAQDVLDQYCKPPRDRGRMTPGRAAEAVDTLTKALEVPAAFMGFDLPDVVTPFNDGYRRWGRQLFLAIAAPESSSSL